MKKIVLPILAALSLSACASREVKIAPGTVIVTGQVVNRDFLSPQVVRANFQNPFDDGSSPAAPLDAADGSFRIEYEIPYGQTVNIRYGDPFYTFFAAPGDSIHITIDAAKLGKGGEQAVVFSGDRGEQNNQFTTAYGRIAAGSFFEDSLEPTALPDAVKSRIQADRDSLSIYAREKGLSKEVVEWVDHEIVCRALYYAAMYREEEPLGEVMSRIFTEVVDIFDARYATSAMYGVDLGWYVQRGLVDFSTVDPGSRESIESFLNDLVTRIETLPRGLARDILLYTPFIEMENGFPGMIAKFEPRIAPLFSSEYVRARIERKGNPEPPGVPLAQPGISRITADMLFEPLPEVDMFQYLAERHPGKAIYIDVSAHWCAPCIAEFPHARTLEGSLAGEDVVFVTLWLESKHDSVTALILRHELPGEHYFFSSDAARLFLSAYGIPGFPTYLLMDKTGKLVNTNAPRPSDPRTEGEIRELLH